MKKVISLLFVISIIVGAASFSSCKKYDENEGVSFSSPKKRIVGEWLCVEGPLYSANYDQLLTLEKEGAAKYTFSYPGFSINEDGTWEFSDDKESIILDIGNYFSGTFIINKLTKTELKVTDEDDNEYLFEKEN